LKSKPNPLSFVRYVHRTPKTRYGSRTNLVRKLSSNTSESRFKLIQHHSHTLLTQQGNPQDDSKYTNAQGSPQDDSKYTHMNATSGIVGIDANNRSSINMLCNTIGVHGHHQNGYVAIANLAILGWTFKYWQYRGHLAICMIINYFVGMFITVVLSNFQLNLLI